MSSRSLLDYLDAPILVGDPDGRVVHLNPSFESRFLTSLDQARGKELATLFEGGAREAVLGAVADVCGGAGPIRFPLRVGDSGYWAVASPISAEDSRVGVVILITVELSSDRAIAKYQDAVADTQQLGDLARDEENGDPARRQLTNEPVDLLFGTDVDPLGWLVEQQHLRLQREPSRKNDLLLVAS